MIYTLLADSVAQPGLPLAGLGMIECGTGPVACMLYLGRPVWASYTSAYRYLRWCPDIERCSVRELDGDWDQDTWQYGDEPFRRTLRTLHVRPLLR